MRKFGPSFLENLIFVHRNKEAITNTKTTKGMKNIG